MDFLEKFKKMILVVGMVVVMLFALGILWISDCFFDDFDDWETQKETNLSEQKQDTDSTKQTNETKEKTTETAAPETTFYSTNDRDTAKKGNLGVFAYSATTGKYESYYIIDFDEGKVYQFSNGSGYDTCYVAQIIEGDLNDVLIVQYSPHGEIWYEGLCFNWKRQPDTLVVQTEYGEKYYFRYTNLQKALEILGEKPKIE